MLCLALHVLLVIHLTLLIWLIRGDVSAAHLLSGGKVVLRLGCLDDSSVIQENTILVGVALRIRLFATCGVDDTIILTNISLCKLEENDRTFFDDSVNDQS